MKLKVNNTKQFKFFLNLNLLIMQTYMQKCADIFKLSKRGTKLISAHFIILCPLQF